MTSTMEIWETTVETHIYLRKTDPRGRETHEHIGGRVGARLNITPEDRELNQQITADPAWDVFTNGMLVVVKATDADTLRNDNAFSQADLVLLLGKTGNAFVSTVRKITSESTLRRLKEEAVRLDARPSQMTVIDEALKPFAPRPFTSYDATDDKGNKKDKE